LPLIDATGRLEHRPKIVNLFGKEFPGAFQPREREKEPASWTEARRYGGMISVCLHAEGGMRFTFPPSGDKKLFTEILLKFGLQKSFTASYSVCHKFLPFGGSQIPLNPPFSKGDFNCNSL
jgi:hypothetical protein